MLRLLTALNLALLILFPLAWTAPLMRAGLLPLFGLDEISVLSGLATLWDGGEIALGRSSSRLFALVAPHRPRPLALDVVAPFERATADCLLPAGQKSSESKVLGTSGPNVFPNRRESYYSLLAKGTSRSVQVETAWPPVMAAPSPRVVSCLASQSRWATAHLAETRRAVR